VTTAFKVIPEDEKRGRHGRLSAARFLYLLPYWVWLAGAIEALGKSCSMLLMNPMIFLSPPGIVNASTNVMR
jgi:hypothetical protein